MKISPKGLAILSILIYWGPANGLWYFWGYLLLLFILFFKSHWIPTKGRYLKPIAISLFVFMALFAISGLVNFFIRGESINNLLWTVFTYGSTISILISFLIIPLSINDLEKIFKFSIGLTIFQVFVGYFQMIEFAGLNSFNPFDRVGGASAGDSFVGTTFDLGIGNLVAVKIGIISLMFLPIWLRKTNFKNTMIISILFLGWILASAIYTLLIGVLVVVQYYLLTKFFRIFSTGRLSSFLFYVLFLVVIGGFFFVTTQKDSIAYIEGTFTGAYRALVHKESVHGGRKVIFYSQTLTKLPIEYPSMLLVGVGPGNYSSRGAWLVSGAYLSNQPSYIKVTPSKIAEEYNISIWNRNMISKSFTSAGSISNQPFSTWFSVFAELGLLALLFFIYLNFTFLKAFNFGIKKIEDSRFQTLSEGSKLSLLFIMYLFFVDNLFEWPIVMGQFFVFGCALIRLIDGKIANQGLV